jgi:hypothetical protein
MTLSLRLLVAVSAVVLALAGGVAAAPRPPARVQVAAKEYSFTLSRSTIRSGRVIVQLANFGEDAHDLVLQRVAPGTRTFATPAVLPKQHAELALRLGPAQYRLWCSIGDHRRRGMRATLTVVAQ